MYDVVMGAGAAANYRSITETRACAGGGGNSQASLQFVYDVIRVRDVRVTKRSLLCLGSSLAIGAAAAALHATNEYYNDDELAVAARRETRAARMRQSLTEAIYGTKGDCVHSSTR